MYNLTIRGMKKVFIIVIVLSMLYSCWVECPLRIVNMEVYSVVNTETSMSSTIEEWYHSEFQNGLLNFSIEPTYSFSGGGGPCNRYLENYPVEQSIKITCNKDVFTINADTIKAGQLLNSCFSITKFEKNLFFSFLISEKATNEYIFSEQYYTFFATLETEKNEIFKDSCIVKRF